MTWEQTITTYKNELKTRNKPKPTPGHGGHSQPARSSVPHTRRSLSLPTQREKQVTVAKGIRKSRTRSRAEPPGRATGLPSVRLRLRRMTRSWDEEQLKVDWQLMEMLEPMGTTGAGSIHTRPLHLRFAAPGTKMGRIQGSRGGPRAALIPPRGLHPSLAT